MSLYVGLDISQDNTHISVVDPTGKEVWRGKVHTSPDAIALVMEKHAKGANKIGMESGPLSPWLYHGLKEKGLPIICIDARSAKAGLQLQSINKTDQKDAFGLAQIMRTGWYREVSVKEIDGHKQQTALTVRKQLVNMRTECINQIRGILKLYGRVLPSKRQLPALKQLMLADDILAQSLGAIYTVLEALQLQIKAIDKTITALADADQRCKVLQTIPGVGKITAFAFAASIGDPQRFKRARAAGAYFGLAPRRDQSGQKDVVGRITKCGDPMVRSYLYEAAGCIIARTKGYSTLKAWGLRVKKRSGWKKACVAVARKLAVIMCKMMQTGECFRFASGAAGDTVLTIGAAA